MGKAQRAGSLHERPLRPAGPLAKYNQSGYGLALEPRQVATADFLVEPGSADPLGAPTSSGGAAGRAIASKLRAHTDARAVADTSVTDLAGHGKRPLENAMANG